MEELGEGAEAVHRSGRQSPGDTWGLIDDDV